MLITFDGIDGSGKTTLANAITAWLVEEGYNAEYTQEPYTPDIGGTIKQILSGHRKTTTEALTLLFVADRFEHCEAMRKEIDNGAIKVCDRFYYSTIAYQCAQGVSFDWIYKMHTGVMDPDIAFFLDISVDQAMARIGERGHKTDIFEKKEFLEKVRNNYLDIVKTHDAKYEQLTPLHLIDQTNKTQEETIRDIQRVLIKRLKSQ
jgi:dTMP kinase